MEASYSRVRNNNARVDMKRVAFAVAIGCIASVVAVFALQHAPGPILIRALAFFAARTGFFWVFVAAAQLIFLAVSKRRKWSRWKTALGAFAMLVPGSLAAGLWWFFFLEGPLFNVAAPLTHQYRI
jgi:hypothetical protein